MQTVESNSILAKLLATENITVQHQSGIKTAMFDLKNRVLLLPIWQDISEDLKHLLLGHETGHALDTPSADEYKAAYEGIAKRIFPGENVSNRLIKTCAGFLNVIEDARIDKRQKRRYPGLRKNYLLGYKELIDRDFFGTKGRDINSMNFIDRLNLYFKGGNVNMSIEFTPEERALIKRVENLEKFDETVLLTEEIYRFCKGQIENQEIDIGLGESEEGEGNDDGFDWNADSDYGDDFDSDEGDSSEDEEGDGEGEAEELSEGMTSGLGGGNDDNHGQLPESMTDRTWQEKQQELVKDVNTDYVYINLPTFDYKNAVHPYKKVLADWRADLAAQAKGKYSWHNVLSHDSFNACRAEMMEWRRNEKDAISFLVKEFEQRKSAEIYSRISIAKTGVIDTNKLHSYRYNDDIFRRLSVIPEGKNHGFVMFLDWSGSMAYNLENPLKQLFTLVLFCKQIQVPFEVYTFKDSDGGNSWTHDKENTLNLGHLTLRQILSSKMNIAEMNEAMTFLWALGAKCYLPCEGLGGTPLNEAIIAAPQIVNEFRAKYKLEIVNTIILTDGESNGCSGNLINSTARGSIPGRKTQYLYNDKQTGKTYEINIFAGYGVSNTNNTTTFLQILKEKTGSNLIGFFLFGETWRNFTYRFNLRENYDYLQKVTKFWKDNKFYPIKSEGYDEYYVIDSKALKNDQNDLEIDTSKSTKQMAKAFSKFAAKKSVNRVLLRNFIDNVTGKSKKVA